MAGRIITMAAAALLAAGAASACTVPQGAEAATKAIAGWINDQRAAHGLPRLAPSAALQGAAASHACDMAQRQYFSHKGPGGSTLRSRLRQAGYQMRAAVENLARGRSAAAATATEGWRSSAGHWANVLNPEIRELGLALATDGAQVYFVFVGAAPR